MKRRKGIDAAYYENNCLADDFAEAKRNGTLIVSKPGESVLEAIRRHSAKGGGSSAPKASVPVAARGG